MSINQDLVLPAYIKHVCARPTLGAEWIEEETCRDDKKKEQGKAIQTKTKPTIQFVFQEDKIANK